MINCVIDFSEPWTVIFNLAPAAIKPRTQTTIVTETKNVFDSFDDGFFNRLLIPSDLLQSNKTLY